MTNKTMTEGKTSTESVGVTETRTDINTYVEAWQSHVNTLNRMRWNLPQKASREKLDRIQEELRELIVVAVKDLMAQREVAK